MHPARIKDLFQKVRKEKQPTRLVERLIAYRCFGINGLRISELTSLLSSLKKQHEETKKQLSELSDEKKGTKIATLKEVHLH